MADHAIENNDAEPEQLDVLEAEEQKPSYSKLVVAVCIVTVIAYTVTSFFYLWNGKPLNDTLTILFFGCFGLEFASLAFIKGRKVKYTGGNAQNKQLPHIELKEEGNEQGRPDQKAHQD